MTLIERTTTEEYDEDKQLTRKTVVEKYALECANEKEPKCDADVALYWCKKADDAMNEEQYQIFALNVMVKMAREWPEEYESADKIARQEAQTTI